ncbi:type I restriction enzyme, S subunit [Vibrio crassostreae]|nr:type I restriction enzyme, S subunit [Vibrio crassostreae]
MSWPLVALKDCCTVVGGATPKREVEAYWDNQDIPWVTPKDISKIKSIYFDDAPEYISQKGFDSCAAHKLPKGSLLLTSRAPIGNVAITTRELCTNQGFKSLVPKGNVDIKYLYFCMIYSADRLENEGNGATFKEVSKKVVEAFKIPLPPLETQKQIAAVLEKADQLRKDCQQMEQELNSLAQSVFIDMFGDPVTNPKGWETESLDTIAKVQIGPFGSQLHKEDYIADGIPLINPTHIVKGQIVPDMNLTLTPEKFETLPNYHLETGDIIMGRRGEMGRTALIDEYSQGWFCGTGSLYIRITSQLVQPAFLNSVMSCSSMKTWLEEQSLGATMPNLNKKILHSIQVPIPTTAVQKNYALALDVLCKQRQEQKEHIKELDGLFNALMQKAFKGELDL